VGAHDDLGRILSFFATDTIVLPDGSSRAQKAHGYGATVLVYNRVEDFFPPEDVPEARLALRAWLQEKRDDARKHGQNLSPEGKKKLEKVLDADASVLRPDLQEVLARHREEDLGVSPHGHLAGLHAPVYLLHGEGDSVIPASETRWLAADVPPGLLRDAVVSPAIEHVEVHGEPTLAQKWELVHFMGQVIGEAEGLP
jgi:pimeloyl-ACP methyl ester carboxylesterase